MRLQKGFSAYTVISGAAALAMLIVLGAALLSPVETMFLWGDSALGAINIVMFALILTAFLAYMLLPRFTVQIKLFSDILTALSLAAAAITLAATSSGNQESWFLAFPWFLRNYGYAVGITLGSLFAAILGSFQLLSASYGRKRTEEKGIKANLLMIGAFVTATAVFGMVYLALWRYSSAFGLCAGLFCFALAIAVAGVALYLVAGEKKTSALLSAYACDKFLTYAKKPAADIALPYKKNNSFASAGLLRKFYCRLFGAAGYSPSKSDIAALWTALAGLIMLLSCAIYGLVDGTEIDFGAGAPVPGTIRGFQLATLAVEILIVCALINFARGEIFAVQKDIFREKKLTLKSKGYPYLHTVKSVFEVAGLMMSVYFFCLVMYLPEVFIKELVFVALGAVLYTAVLGAVKHFKKSSPVDLIAKLMYWFAFGLFLLAAVCLLRDSVGHGASNTTGVYVDVWFPFEFIHSFWHVSLMGLCVGIMLANSLFYKFFRAESFAPRNARALGLAFAVYLIAHMCVGIGYLLIFPEGYDSWPPTSNMKLGGMRIVELMTIVFLSMAGAAVVIDIFKDIHIFHFRKHPDTLFFSLKKHVIEHTAEAEIISRTSSVRTRNKLRIKGAVAWVLVISLGVAVLSVPAVALTAESAHARTVVAEGDGYFIWTTDSYERISPEMKVVKKYVEDYVPTIRVGRNEYGSQQIVFTTKEYLKNLSAKVSINNADYETIEDCDIRYIDYMYDDTFAEILYPVKGQTLEAGQTGGFWLNFFTAYDQTPGTYDATVRFTFETNSNVLGKIVTEKHTKYVRLKIEVGRYVMPQSTHYFFTMPAPDGSVYSEYYAKRHINTGDYDITGFLMNENRWYLRVDNIEEYQEYDFIPKEKDEDDEEEEEEDFVEGRVWNWSGKLTKKEQEYYKKNYGIVAATGTELWDGWAEYQIEQINDYGMSFVRVDDLNSINQAIKSKKYWNEDGTVFDAEKYRETYGKKIYDYVYYLTDFLSRYKINESETLLDRTYIKWKDEWDQAQFFPDNPVTDKLMERQELYQCYALELEIYKNARLDAIADNQIQSVRPRGFSFLANIDPMGANADIIFDYFEVYCPLSYKTTDAVLNYCEENGKEVWVYTCVQPFLPYPNQFAYNQLYETHVTQWQIYEGNLRGYWLWRSDLKYNSLYFYGYNGFLDGQFIYFADQNRTTFYSGIRLEASCESIEEAELFIALDQLYNDLKNRGMMSAAEADACLAELQTKVESVASQGKNFTKTYQNMREIMDWTRDRLEQLATTYYADDPASMDAVVESVWE